MVRSSFTNFFILSCQGDQVLQEPFIKGNVGNSSFGLVSHNNCTGKVHILSTYTSVATNFTKAVLSEVGLSDIWCDIC